jgi:hypothetical protein
VNNPRISLLFHSHKPYKRVKALVDYALRLGYNQVWVNDTPKGDPIALINRLNADFGSRLRLGIAALNTAKWLGVRPELIVSRMPPGVIIGLGLGDQRWRSAVQVDLDTLVHKMFDIAKVAMDLGHVTLLAAQGPKMLGLAPKFDGVLFGFLRPDPLAYARSMVGGAELYATAPSLVYSSVFRQSDYEELLSSARYVYYGASSVVKRLFPRLEDYYVFGDYSEIRTLMDVLSGLGVREAILAHPQTMNARLIAQAHGLVGS